MQKRILSLLLVLCMLLPMIPVGVLSAVAAEAEALPSSTLNLEAVTLPESGGKVTLPAGWSFVAHGAQQHPNTTAPHNGYETTYVLDTYVTGGIYCTLKAAENGTGKDFAASWSDGQDGINGIDATRLPVICFNASQSAQINMGINACVVYSGGYAYEAPYTGNITIALDNVATGGGTTGVGWGGTGDTLVALFVGGEMVWPAGGSYDDRATWYNLNGNGGQNKTDLVNNGVTVKDVYVEAGQAVEFLVFHSWWDNAVRADMTVAYTSQSLPRSVLRREDATIDANYKIVLPSGWGLVARAAGNYNNKKSITTVYHADNGTPAAGFGNEGGWIISEELGWNTSPRVNWTGKYDRSDSHGPWMGIGPTTSWVGGYAYTATRAGYVDISIDALRYYDLGDDKYVAVFVNGTMVWPTVGGSYSNVNAWMPADQVIAHVDEWLYDDTVYPQLCGCRGEPIYGDLLKGHYLNVGGTVEFLVRTAYGPGNAVQADLSVTYTSLGQEPTNVTASVGLGDTFSVTFSAPGADGIYINGAKYAGNTLSGIPAKDIAKDITYATYTVTNGTETVSAAKATSVMEILAQYTTANSYDVKTANLAQAARRYGYAAAAYFDEATVPSDVLTAIDALAAPSGSTAVNITDVREETATFRGVNLFVADPMDIKVFFALSKVPAGTLTLKVGGDKTATVTAFETVGGEYVFTVEGIPMACYGSALTFTLYDGETPISETLTYGVGTYAARMYAEYGTSNVTFGRLLKTIADLGQQAKAYGA